MSDQDTIRRICIYCASSPRVDNMYKQAAAEAGRFCARKGWEIVYGGAHIGLMGALADAALAEGGTVTGIIPGFLKEREIAHSGLARLEVTATLHERQHRMAELADAFVMLPGGLGTLAEFFETLTWKQLGLHDKPIAIVNTGNYWGALLKMMDKAGEAHFLPPGAGDLFTVLETIENMPALFAAAQTK